MLDYKFDLEWLRLNHPSEYAKIPPDMLDSAQMHCGAQRVGCSPDSTDPNDYNWMIFRLYGHNEEPAEGEITQVELDIPRPIEDPDSECPHHTLLVSKALCTCNTN